MWLQLQQAEFRRPSRAACNEPCTTHHRPGKRLKRLRGFVGFKLWRCWWKSRSLALLGAGRRAATLRNRVRLLRNYFSWLTPRSSLPHFTGALCGLPQGTCFGAGQQRSLEECESYFHLPQRGDRYGQANRLTATLLYDAVYREILASCEPGRPVKQAPRFPVGHLALVENCVTTDSNPAYLWMYGWWVLLQCWGTMTFSDHRGLSPADLSRRWESNRAFEEDEDHGHRQERVCEASESGCKFIHLFAPVALSRLADPERAGPHSRGTISFQPQLEHTTVV